MLISLSQTPPDAFDTLYVCGALSSSTEGLLRVAANQVLGSVWRARQIPPRPAASKNDTTPRALRFGGPPGASVTASGAGLFLHQKGLCSGSCKPVVDVTVGAARLFYTYVTVLAPCLTTVPDAELHVEAMNYVHEALQNLWALDKELAVLVFPTKAH